MKSRFILYRRGEMFYCEDTQTGKQQSLRTKDETEAKTLLAVKNEATRQPAMNLQIAQVYLQHADAALASRSWLDVMNQVISLKSGPTKERYEMAIKDEAFESLKDRKLLATTAEHFLSVLKAGTVSTNVYLRRFHNFAVAMHWLPWPILPRTQWPPIKHREWRAITREEHEKIIAREHNPATKAYYQMLWHLGGSQTDVALLTAEDADWSDRTISFRRKKTGVPVVVSFGEEAAQILRTLPSKGQLFPRLARLHERHRGRLFLRRLETVKVTGVSLHSYRYAWAERAKSVGMPERYAQQALGHSSKALARAYSKKAKVIVPALEELERKVIPMPTSSREHTTAENPAQAVNG